MFVMFIKYLVTNKHTQTQRSKHCQQINNSNNNKGINIATSSAWFCESHSQLCKYNTYDDLTYLLISVHQDLVLCPSCVTASGHVSLRHNPQMIFPYEIME
jgi:hypothetical protein